MRLGDSVRPPGEWIGQGSGWAPGHQENRRPRHLSFQQKPRITSTNKGSKKKNDDASACTLVKATCSSSKDYPLIRLQQRGHSSGNLELPVLQRRNCRNNGIRKLDIWATPGCLRPPCLWPCEYLCHRHLPMPPNRASCEQKLSTLRRWNLKTYPVSSNWYKIGASQFSFKTNPKSSHLQLHHFSCWGSLWSPKCWTCLHHDGEANALGTFHGILYSLQHGLLKDLKVLAMKQVTI